MRETPFIKPIPSADCAHIDLRIPRIPIMMIETPRGQIAADEVPGLLTMDFKRAGGQTKVGIMLYRLLPSVGMICQIDAATARQTGLSLIALADSIDTEEAAKAAAEPPQV